MAYLVKKRIKNKDYYYLVASVKLAGRIKKFQLYIGAKRPFRKQLTKLKDVLNKRIESYMSKFDPFLTLLTEREKNELEAIKKSYKKTLSPAVKQNYYEWFLTNYTYDTNAIEGSTLTLRETAMVLFEGVTPYNRPLRDVRAAENHKKAYDWMMNYKHDLSVQFILRLHKIMTSEILSPSESGKFRRVQVYIRGASDVPPPPHVVKWQLMKLLSWYKSNKKRYHTTVVAAKMHAEFERIHPFVDFNGRTGRLLLNFILFKTGYPPIDIRNKDKQHYYEAIRNATGGNIKPLVKLIERYLKEATPNNKT